MFSQFARPADKKKYQTVTLNGGEGRHGAGKSICLVSDSRATAAPTADQMGRWLVAQGWDVTLLDLTPFGSMPHEPHRLNGGHERPYRYVKLAGQFEETNWYAPMQALSAHHWLKDNNHDVILFQHGFGAGYFCTMAKELGLAFAATPLVVTPDDPYAFWLQSAEHMPAMATFRTDAEIDFLERITVAKADAILFTNTSVLQWMQDGGWTAPVQIGLLGTGKGMAAGEWLAKLSSAHAVKEKMAPLITVCIVMRGNGGVLEELQSSLKEQTYKNFEVILTAAGHVKTAIQKAKGEYVFFLDENDVLLPDAMDILSRCAQAGIDVLTSVQGKHPHSDSTLGMRARIPARTKASYSHVSVSWIHYGANMPVALYENIVGDTGVLIRKEVLSSLDGLAQEIGTHPGFELLVRAAQEGYAVHALPEIVVLCRTDKTGRALRGGAAFKANKRALSLLTEKIPPKLRPLTFPFKGNVSQAKPISRFPQLHHSGAQEAFMPPALFAPRHVKQPIQIVLCADDHYVMQVCVTIASILSTTVSHVDVNLVTTMSDKNVKCVQVVVDHFGQTIKIIRPEAALSGKFPASHMWGRSGNATYWRLGLPDYLPGHGRAIYLDCDIIVRRDLGELWQLPLNNCYVAAARDRFPLAYKSYAKDFGGDYFNAGVMVVNLDAWRKDAIVAKTLEAIKSFEAEHYPYTFHDQSPLNKVIGSRWQVLHPSWNFYEGISAEHATHFHLDKADLEWLEENAAICHFLGPQKPWQPDYDAASAYGREYRRYEDRIKDLLVKANA